jgi:hypothetical protein
MKCRICTASYGNITSIYVLPFSINVRDIIRREVFKRNFAATGIVVFGSSCCGEQTLSNSTNSNNILNQTTQESLQSNGVSNMITVDATSSSTAVHIELSPTGSFVYTNVPNDEETQAGTVVQREEEEEATNTATTKMTPKETGLFASIFNNNHHNRSDPELPSRSSSSPGVISQRILRHVKEHQLALAKEQSQPCCSFRRTVGLMLGVLPVVLFALEMIPQRCNLCLDGRVELGTYFVLVALCGGFGAILYSNEYWNYSLARLLGGAVAALGALFTCWMILRTITSNLAFFFLFVGILGAMPGLLVYFVVKILSDECWVSDLEDFREEFTGLNLLRAVDHV